MRMLVAVILVGAAVLGLLLTRGGPEPASVAALDAPSSAVPWACSAYSDESGIAGAAALWSYRLCGGGSEDRRIELRFRGPAERSDSIEYRVWLAEPADCDAAPWQGPVSILVPGLDRVSAEALAVAFSAYRGELWLCARSLRVAAPAEWRPQRARHGDAI